MTDETTTDLTELCAAEPETDIGNGRRFRRRHGQEVLSITKIGWHGYDGRRWCEDEDGSVVRPLAHKTAEAIRFECAHIVAEAGETVLIEAGETAIEAMAGRDKPGRDAGEDEKRAWAKLEAAVKTKEDIEAKLERRRQERRRYAKSSCNSAKLDNMLKESAPYLSRTVDGMNGDPLAFNTTSGTLRFVQVASEKPDGGVFWYARLDEHRREDFITKLSMAGLGTSGLSEDEATGTDGGASESHPLSGELLDQAFFEQRAHAEAPVFHEFLKRVQPSIEARAYLRRLSGYMLTGLTGEQIIAFFFGIGANGKSTFTEVIAKILADYAVTLGIESFTGDVRRGGADATPDLARLNGAYACFASEGDEQAKLKEGLIKLLTGDDKIAVRKLHQDFVEIAIKAKFVITGNHKPPIRGDDDGIWRRVHLFEWPVQIPAAERDRHLPAKLFAERDGILAWMIAGALEFLAQGGLNPPESVLAAVQEHREDSDPVGAFVRAACEVTGDEKDTARPPELHEGYVKFCMAEGMTPFGPPTFNRRLSAKASSSWKGPDGRMRQFTRRRSNGAIYEGIRLKEEYRGGGGVVPPGGFPEGYGG